MATSTQSARPSEWLKAESKAKEFTRAVKKLASGQQVVSGALLCEDYGTPTLTYGFVGAGNGIPTLNSVQVAGIAGKEYTATCIAAAANAGTFRVDDPDGVALGLVTVGGGATAVSNHFTITIADGATDFAVGDKFRFVINKGADATVKLINLVTGTGPGNNRVAGIAYEDCDATAAAKNLTVVKSDALVMKSKLTTGDQSDMTNVLVLEDLANAGIEFASEA